MGDPGVFNKNTIKFLLQSLTFHSILVNNDVVFIRSTNIVEKSEAYFPEKKSHFRRDICKENIPCFVLKYYNLFLENNDFGCV